MFLIRSVSGVTIALRNVAPTREVSWMAKVTYYAVVPYEIGKRGKLMQGTPVPASSADQAIRMAHRMEQRYSAVVAFSRTGNPDTGDYGDPVFLAVLGGITREALEAEAA